MVRSSKSQRKFQRALLSLLSEKNVRAAARLARVSEKDLRGWMAYPPFRTRYNQYRGPFNVMSAALGHPEAPSLDKIP
jgi:hypothetical protein